MPVLHSVETACMRAAWEESFGNGAFPGIRPIDNHEGSGAHMERGANSSCPAPGLRSSSTQLFLNCWSTIQATGIKLSCSEELHLSKNHPEDFTHPTVKK